MVGIAKIFRNGASQAVRLPKEFRFEGDEVCIKRIGTAVLLYPKEGAWDLMADAIGQADDDFLPSRQQPTKAEKAETHLMRLMLDTDLCIDLMRGKSAGAFKRLRSLAADEAGISTITLAELRFGAAKSNRQAHHESLIVAFCAPLAIATFDALAAESYGTVRVALERVGTPIGPLDTLIAAHALALGATLVTANVREFQRVAGLAVENWRSE